MQNVILDLDETLIRTLGTTAKYSKKMDKLSDFHFVIQGQFFWVKKRPGLQLFLDFLFKYFQVGIWTAAQADYATQVSQNILTHQQVNKIRFIYSRNFCHRDQGGFTKPLAKIFKIYPDFDQNNTLMIDNTARVMKYNPYNGIYIPDFYGESDDDLLYHIRNKILEYYQQPSIETNNPYQLGKTINEHINQ